MSPVTPTASFPTSVWDTFFGDRDDRSDYTPLGPEGGLAVCAEVEAIEKHLRPTADDLVIWVAPHGVAANATGAIVNPYATIAAALAAITSSKKIVALLPGTHVLSGVTVIPVAQTGVKIIGIGGASSVTITAITGNQAFSLTPGAQGAAYVLTIEGVTLNQFAAKKGLYIDDTAIDGSVTVNLKDVHMVMDSSGSSIDLLHAVNQTVTINCEDCTFTGPLTIDCINASDAFNFTRCVVTGGIASDAGAVAAAFTLKDSEVLHAGITGGHGSQTLTVVNCWTPLAPFDANDAAGSHTAAIKTENNVFVDANAVASLANGSIAAPYDTVQAGIAAMTATRKTLLILPGSYTLAGSTALPVATTGMKIIGVGGSSAVIIAGANANQAFSLTPGAQGGAFAITIEGITINQYAAKKGLYIDDTSIDGSVTVNLKDVHMVMDSSGDSVDLLHAVSGQLVILNFEDSTFTGPFAIDSANAGDRFNFTRCVLPNIVTDATDIASAFLFKYSTLASAGMSGGHSTQTIVVLYSLASDNTLVETGEFAGSHTETLIAPTT
ncbi:hypothetical protein LCGC14_1281160 [marine sediment metagenome]|uniref:Uncharacterized protein n=1 Tax=marine sediment metagenome TaxID=412755 RepID=A0A0F9LG91_9ZZZZ